MLSGRVERICENDIPRIIETEDSVFSRAYAEKLDKGSRTSSKQLYMADGYCGPGYYGPRGLEVIEENTSELYVLIRARVAYAGAACLPGIRDVGSYFVKVVYPEIAVRLAMEDMAIDMAAALRVLEEGAELGDVLNSV